MTIHGCGQRSRIAWIWLDIAAACNLSCRLCYTTPMRSKSLMSLAVFEATVEAVRQSSAELAKFHLNWRGEPVLNPRLPQMLSKIAQLGWHVEWHTNATLLTSDRVAGILTSNARQTIYLSLDGGHKQSFEQNRGDGMWSKALTGAETLLEARGDRPWPKVGIYQLDLGVSPDDYDRRFARLLQQVDRHVLMAPIDLDGKNIDNSDRHCAIPMGPCFWLGHALAIDHLGRAHTCLLRNGTELGSIMELSLDDLLDRAQELRSKVAACGRTALTGCSKCNKQEGAPQIPTQT